MIDMILQDAARLTAGELRCLVERPEVMVVESMRGPAAEPDRCPRCGHAHVVRKGRDRDGSQRWLCGGCGRTFSRKTMGLLALTKLEPWQWTRFVELEGRHAPLSECAAACGVSWPTAHLVRTGLCEVMEAATPASGSGPGVSAQVDGTYVNESLSGLGRMPRASHKTGHDVRARGISNMKVCVLCGTNSLGDAFLSLCDRGRPTDAAVTGSLSGVVCGGTRVSTDDHKAYSRVLPALRVTEHLVFPSDGSAGEGLGSVNALHKRLDDFLAPFNGVSTRWLPHYLAWLAFEERVRRDGADLADAMAGLVANGAYRLTRRQLYGAPRPFFEYWEGKVPVWDGEVE